MKTALFVAFLALSLTVTFGFRARKSKVPSLLSNLKTMADPLDSLTQFYTALGDHFDLDFKDQIKCFDKDSARVKLQLPVMIQSLAYFQVNGQQVLGNAVGKEMAELVNIIKDETDCQFATKSYSAFMKKIGLSKNVTKAMKAIETYFLGEINFFAEQNLEVVALLSKEQYSAAGDKTGALFEEVGKNASDSRTFRNQVAGFHLGEFYALNISAPLQFWDCFTEDSASTYFELFTTWAAAVAKSSPTTANVATAEWVEEKGKDLLADLTEQVKCELATDDAKRYNKAVGYDVHSTKFKKLLAEWCKDNQAEYFYLMKAMNDAFERNSSLGAGYVFSLLNDNVAKANKDLSLE